jgi:hypothetical protein
MVETLIAAAVGALIGVGSTLITDFVRTRRDLDQKWVDTKRFIYVRFLVAMTQAHSRMKVAALEQLSATEKQRAVRAAFHDDPQHAEAKAILREMFITAPDSVSQLANETYYCLRAIRDTLSLPSVTDAGPEYRAVNRPFWDKISELQRVMRDDLHPGPRHHRHRKELLEVSESKEEADPALTLLEKP